MTYEYVGADESIIAVTELVSSLGFSANKKKFTGVYPNIEYIPLSKLKVSTEYQRLLSRATIKKAKDFDPVLCQPLFVALRPNGEYLVVDGQHKAAIASVYCQDNDDKKIVLPCVVFDHLSNGNKTYKQCVEAEALIFSKLNTTRKNVTKVEKIRAGLACGDKEAIDANDDLISVGVNVEGIGYLEGYPCEGYAKLAESISKYGVENTRLAVDFLRPIYEKVWCKDAMQGNFVGGIACVFKILQCLGKGKKSSSLKSYLDIYIEKMSPSLLSKNTAGPNSSILIARRIINRYNDMVQVGAFDGNQVTEKFMTSVGFGDPSK